MKDSIRFQGPYYIKCHFYSCDNDGAVLAKLWYFFRYCTEKVREPLLYNCAFQLYKYDIMVAERKEPVLVDTDQRYVYEFT